MRVTRKLAIAVGLAAVAGGGGASAAVAVHSDGETDNVPAGEATRAGEAALRATGGGQVLGVQREDDAGRYEVTIRDTRGAEVDVTLDPRFAVVGRPVADGADHGGAETGGAADRSPGRRAPVRPAPGVPPTPAPAPRPRH